MKKKELESAFAVVSEIIYAWKPFAWAPADSTDPEFFGEVKGIVKQIPRIQSQVDAAHAVSRVFSSSFGDSSGRFTPQQCASVGEELFSALQRACLVNGSDDQHVAPMDLRTALDDKDHGAA